MKKFILTLLLLAAIDLSLSAFSISIDVEEKKDRTLASVNGSAGEFAAVRQFHWFSNNLFAFAALLNVALVALIYRSEIQSTIQKLKQ